MNFFGHALVASWIEASPRWVLGAMLPDFASMARVRHAGADDEMVARGIAFHHRTDDAFHGAPTFLALQADGIDALEAGGVGRGPSRAVAHVGTELLLDGLLLCDAAACASYARAVTELAPRSLGLRVRGGSEGEARLHSVLERVAEHGLPTEYRSPEHVGERLRRILAPRPRLALDEPALRVVVPWLEAVQRTLALRKDELLDEVRDRLAAPSPAVDTSRQSRVIMPPTPCSGA